MAQKTVVNGWMYAVAFTADEVYQIKIVLPNLPGIIEDLQHACGTAMYKKPDLTERKGRLEKMHADVKSFLKTMEEIQGFAYDNFQIDGRVNEVAQSASKAKSELIRLEGMLRTKAFFKNFDGGRPKNERAMVLVRQVKWVFDEHGLDVTNNPAGKFFQVVVICLNAIQELIPNEKLPVNDPTRIVRAVLKDETRQK